MPVQINEMVIKAHVREPAEKTKQTAPAAPASALDKAELIKECTEAILELLHRKNER
jgi:phenylpyruvate tautomerase PptA (4-oxalocrotonate tautomerase family)